MMMVVILMTYVTVHRQGRVVGVPRWQRGRLMIVMVAEFVLAPRIETAVVLVSQLEARFVVARYSRIGRRT